MNNIFYLLMFNFLSIIVIIFILYPNKNKEINSFSAYYNSEGAFAGFIQKNKIYIGLVSSLLMVRY